MDVHGLIDFVLSHVLLLVTSLYAIWLLYIRVTRRLWKLPPGPYGLPVLGYAPFIGKDVHKSLAELSKKYGKICSATAGLKRFVVVDDFETAKELLNHPALLGRPPHFFNILPGEGGFGAMSGQLWEQERKFMMQAVKNVGLGRNPWNDIIQSAVTEFVGEIASRNGQPMNISGLLSRYALSNITSLIFGGDYARKQPNPDITILDEGNKTFKQHFQFTNPPAVHTSLLKYFVEFNINGYRQKARNMELFCDVLRKEIVKRLNSEEYDPCTDLIQSYFRYSLKQNFSQEEVDRSINYLVGHLSLFVTTADTATTPTQWLLLQMANDPGVQAKVHAELDEVVGRHGLISWDNWKQFPYSMACIREMLRWTTVLPIFAPRYASETFEFQGYSIPKNTVVFVNGWSMHRHSKYWDHPDEFRPERFLSKEKKLTKVDGYGPFSFGRRSCPGENITMMALFLFFTGIMQRFAVKTPTESPPDLTQHYIGIMEPTPQELCFHER